MCTHEHVCTCVLGREVMAHLCMSKDNSGVASLHPLLRCLERPFFETQILGPAVAKDDPELLTLLPPASTGITGKY